MPSGKPMKIDLQRCEWCRQLPSTDRIVIKRAYHRMCEHCAGLVMADAVSMRTDEPNVLRCGFCGKLRDEVASLIEGLDGLRTATNARLRPSSWRRSASAGDRAHARTAGKPAQRRSSGRQRAASRQRTGEAPTGPRSGWPARRVSRGGGCSRRAPAGARPRHRRREERHSSAAILEPSCSARTAVPTSCAGVRQLQPVRRPARSPRRREPDPCRTRGTGPLDARIADRDPPERIQPDDHAMVAVGLLGMRGQLLVHHGARS